MRLAELITAAVLALLSIYLMFKSAELDIGYLPGEGPGGGAWPFLVGISHVDFNYINSHQLVQKSHTTIAVN